MQPAEQIGHLHEMGVGGLADELVLQYEDLMAFVPRIQEQASLPTTLLSALTSLGLQLQELDGGPADIWLDEALLTNPLWQTVRRSSAEVLRALEEYSRATMAE